MDLNRLVIIFREQRVKARRNNKELLKEELQFFRSFLNISRLRTSQVAESEYIRYLSDVE